MNLDAIREAARDARRYPGVDVRMAPSEAEALCDLAEAVRARRSIDGCEWCYDEDCTGNGICPCDHACHDAAHQADMALDAALARLDGEREGSS